MERHALAVPIVLHGTGDADGSDRRWRLASEVLPERGAVDACTVEDGVLLENDDLIIPVFKTVQKSGHVLNIERNAREWHRKPVRGSAVP